MSAAAGPVGFEARESVLPSYAYPVARYALPAPGRRRETLKLAAGPLAGAAGMQDDTVTTSAKRAGVTDSNKQPLGTGTDGITG